MEQFSLRETVKKALDLALDGKVSQELKFLFNQPYREQVPWCDFPSWARPDLATECAHEG